MCIRDRLKKQLTGLDASASLDEVGTVLQVGDGIARVYGLSNVQYGELVQFDSGLEGIVLNLEEDNVGVVLLGPSKEISEGDTVKRTQRIASINVGEKIVGRVVNALGKPIDGKGNIEGKLYEMPPVSYTHLRAHETKANLVCRLLLEKKNKTQFQYTHIYPFNHHILTNNHTIQI